MNIMKKYFLIALLLVSCNKVTEMYKYRVVNLSKTNSGIYYTDTIEQNGDSIGYHNSNGRYVLVSDSSKEYCHIYKLK